MVLSFPLVGKDHPLRQHATGILFKSAILSMMLHGFLAGGRAYVAHRFPPNVEFETGYTVPFFLQPKPDFDPVAPIHVKPVVPAPVIPDYAIPEPVSFETVDFDLSSIPGAVDPRGLEGVDPGSDGFAILPVAVADSSTVYDEARPAGIPPQLIFIPQPEYPQVARDAGVEGDVVLRVKVDTNGRVAEIQILSGVPLLNEGAVQAVARAVFRPAEHNDRIVASWVVLPIRFTLD